MTLMSIFPQGRSCKNSDFSVCRASESIFNVRNKMNQWKRHRKWQRRSLSRRGIKYGGIIVVLRAFRLQFESNSFPLRLQEENGGQNRMTKNCLRRSG